MAYKLIIYHQKKWAQNIDDIPPDLLPNLIETIRLLAQDPWPSSLNIKKLNNYPKASYRLRIGAYRVLFDWDKKSKTVFLLTVLHRSKLY